MTKDIAVIGGSTAGFYTAYLLARKGYKVRVYEAEEDIQTAPRALIVTSYMLDLMGSLCESAIINKISRFELFTDGRAAMISLQRPDLVVDRSKLIRCLAAKAEANGVEVLTGRRFLALRPNGKELAFTISRNGQRDSVEESANILVGADGAFSNVAKDAGWPKQPTVPLFQAVVELPKDMPSDKTIVWFIPEDTPYFYWLIPHSPTQGVLGLIGEEDGGGRGSLERFLEGKGLVPIEYQTARIPLHSGWNPYHLKIGEGDVYLVGDAAGHVKVSTVGGLVTGFRGAQCVAEAIVNGGARRELCELRWELACHMLIRKTLNRFTQDDYNRLLCLLNPSVRRSLGLLSRDETSKLLLGVFLRQPRLLFLGLRALLAGK
jgi:digeranylgeranylglycerophospholipid reductase